MRCAALALITTACLASFPASAIPDRFKDPQDGALDVSDYLLRHRGVLPVPLVVTEPAVGYGGGVALAYFSQSFEDSAERARAGGQRVQPPDIIGAAGIRTETARAAAASHTWASSTRTAGVTGAWPARPSSTSTISA